MRLDFLQLTDNIHPNMKNLFIASLISLFLTSTAIAVTNSPPKTLSLENAKNIAASVGAPTNINQVLIEILSGTKDAAKEIYGASKEAIHKSINFVGEQAPEVITQFLTWKFCEAFLQASAWGIFGGFLFFVSHYLRKKYAPLKAEYGSYSDPPVPEFCWVGSVLALFGVIAVIIFGIGPSVQDMVKIKMAPKVYIIEYVVDTVKGHTK